MLIYIFVSECYHTLKQNNNKKTKSHTMRRCHIFLKAMSALYFSNETP